MNKPVETILYSNMQRNTFFAVFCALSVGMNAFVAGVPPRPRPRLSWAEIKQLGNWIF